VSDSEVAGYEPVMADNPERDRKDPYPADQQFGAAASEMQEKLDSGGKEGSDEMQETKPRAGNKADPA
jgi:hypothetical protein